MHADVELVIGSERGRWVARGAAIAAAGATLAELDEDVRRGLAASGRFAPGARVTVWMGCDPGVIPAWMRPYHAHYFNRIVDLEL